ncbi:hypothetical protein J5N97_016026 [Dioscorea zingiberensis]|uniref:Uncharacterized protein n=1 Tax=Dioscorea zingiberensis TaxID=325984 RepID=A0A9D5CIM0_9LILI|nr:hypothetical protein J5N97_016026 [Dioscorea zingiberensis]
MGSLEGKVSNAVCSCKEERLHIPTPNSRVGWNNLLNAETENMLASKESNINQSLETAQFSFAPKKFKLNLTDGPE